LTAATCALEQCAGTLTCGTSVPGGACDQIDACCRDQDAAASPCTLVARIAHIAGDALCTTLLTPPELQFICAQRDE
jgi:hypothetical protein